MYYFDEALIEAARNNQEKMNKLLEKSIENDEVFGYYLFYGADFSVGNYQELLDKNDSLAIAVKMCLILDNKHRKESRELAEHSGEAIAFYEQYKFLSTHGDDVRGNQYLKILLDMKYPLAYYEFADKIAKTPYKFDTGYDNKKLLYFIKKAVEYKFLPGYLAYGQLYAGKCLIRKDINKAINIYRKLIEDHKNSVYIGAMHEIIKVYEQYQKNKELFYACLELSSNVNESYGIAYKHLSYFYQKDRFKHKDIIKALIYKKCLCIDDNDYRVFLDVSKIYLKKIRRKDISLNMAYEYMLKFFNINGPEDFGDQLMHHYYPIVKYLMDNKPKKKKYENYYELGINYLNDNNQEEAYKAFLNGFLVDQKKCFKGLANFYREGIVVEKDVAAANALMFASKNKFLFKRN